MTRLTIRRGGTELDPAVFDEVIDVNLSGTMRVCAAARPPADVSTFSASSSRSSLRPAIITAAPMRTYAVAISRPMPEPPPVMNAVRPARVSVENIVAPVEFAEGPLLRKARASARRSRAPVGRPGPAASSVLAVHLSVLREHRLARPKEPHLEVLRRKARGNRRHGTCLAVRLCPAADGVRCV